jgi:Novel toxin 16
MNSAFQHFDDGFDADIDDMVDRFVDELDAFGAGIPLLPPGRCTEARHSALQAQVHPLCDAAQRTCDDLTGCHSVSQRMLRNALCIGARARVNRECFDGGNRTHRQAEHQARVTGRRCRQRWRELGCNRRPQTRRNVMRFDDI